MISLILNILPESNISDEKKNHISQISSKKDMNETGFPIYVLSMPNTRPMTKRLTAKISFDKNFNAQPSPDKFGKSVASNIINVDESKDDDIHLNLDDIELDDADNP